MTARWGRGARTLVAPPGPPRRLGLFVSPPDDMQRDAVRLMYVHVPAAWVAYLAFGVTTLASVLYLWRRTRSPAWDTVAGASAELGVMFTGLTLVLGSLWGRPVWGVWWAWDARLVSTAVLFFLYLGYLALRRMPPTPRCGPAAAPSPPSSPSWTCPSSTSRSSGGGRCTRATVFNPDLNPTIEGSMARALLVGVVAFTLTTCISWSAATGWPSWRRVWTTGVLAAIAERRAEAEAAPARRCRGEGVTDAAYVLGGLGGHRRRPRGLHGPGRGSGRRRARKLLGLGRRRRGW